MQQFISIAIRPAITAFVIAMVATPLVRHLARRIGAVAMPKKDRWHSRPTAMLGGIAIYAAVILALLTETPRTSRLVTVVATTTVLFLLGLVDDFLHLKPYHKLIGQLMAALVIVGMGIALPWTQWQLVNMLLTLFWLVGITNAVNMLDNMDGLAGGIAAIAAAFLAINFVGTGNTAEAAMLVTFAAALVGFLVYNSSPASIFMGDCGSMFVGFFLGSVALLGSGGGRSRSMMAVLAVPVLALLIPIFDTTFVTVLRKLAGRAASQGGRDHTSHRLVALGLSERRAVWMLYAFAFVAGLLSVVVQKLTTDVSLALIAIFCVSMTIVAAFLSRVRVYGEDETPPTKPLVTFLINLTYKRRVFEVMLDVVLIVFSYYSAYALLFGPMNGSGDWTLFLQTVPIVLFTKLAVFLATGMYRGLWRYTSLSDVIVFTRAVIGGSLMCVVVILYVFRFTGFSRTAFVIDALLLLFLISLTRFAFRVIRRILPMPQPDTARRILIYGAGDGGELLIRELKSNSALEYVVVGLLDDDPRKTGRDVHGYPVHRGDKLRQICSAHDIEAILISSAKFSQKRLREIAADCREVGVDLRRMRIDIAPITNVDLGIDLHHELVETPDATYLNSADPAPQAG